MKWPARLIALPGAEQGTALVEFTLFTPVLFVMSIYTMDFGLYWYNALLVQNAAQSAAQYAIVHGTLPSKTDFTGNGILVSPPMQNYYCPSSTSPYSLGSPVAQTSTCSDGSSPGKYFNISTSGTYRPLVRYSLLGNATYSLSGIAWVRVQ